MNRTKKIISLTHLKHFITNDEYKTSLYSKKNCRFNKGNKGGEKLVMEKLLDDILSDLQDSPQKQTGFSEYDRLMIKYALTPKGHNLRNRVAHGLMDLWEYSFVDIVILFNY